MTIGTDIVAIAKTMDTVNLAIRHGLGSNDPPSPPASFDFSQLYLPSTLNA